MAVTILSLTTGEELDRWLLDYCQLIRLLIQKKRVDNNVILVENAKKIVQENFSDQDLSVESVCDALHVSTSHFSKIFKQETGRGDAQIIYLLIKLFLRNGGRFFLSASEI